MSTTVIAVVLFLLYLHRVLLRVFTIVRITFSFFYESYSSFFPVREHDRHKYKVYEPSIRRQCADQSRAPHLNLSTTITAET